MRDIKVAPEEEWPCRLGIDMNDRDGYVSAVPGIRAKLASALEDRMTTQTAFSQCWPGGSRWQVIH